MQAKGGNQPHVQDAKLSAVLFWLTKYDGEAPLCEMTRGANVAVVGMGVRGLLEVENLCLRQQLLVLNRRQFRPRLSDRDRRFRILASRRFPGFVAATVLRRHRRGWRAYWRRQPCPVGVNIAST
jgi:hypothetical protein